MKIRTSLDYNTAPACYKEKPYAFVGSDYDMWTHNGNCTHYAYARSCELANRDIRCDFTRFPDAGNWLNSDVSTWDRGDLPKPGSIGVTDKHVFIVEDVYEDGTCLISESSWKEYIFKTRKKKVKKGTTYTAFAGKVKGFLYNPYVDSEPTPTPTPTTITTEQAITKMAEDVIAGKYGNGVFTRKNNLYSAIQRKVNEILRG